MSRGTSHRIYREVRKFVLDTLVTGHTTRGERERGEEGGGL